MSALYNEIEPAARAVLAALIGDGVIAPGRVEPRSIADLTPDDLADVTQAHFFAGGGLWSVAARMAGWNDARPLWTASCPCQPFSAAGKGLGRDDPRHLWPDLFRLVAACRPAVLVGEQVASAAGLDWFDRVAADLAGAGYACRAVDLPAAAVDAPHIRQRLYWVAVADGDGERCGGGGEPECAGIESACRRVPVGFAADRSERGALGLADADRGGCRGRAEDAQRGAIGGDVAQRAADGEMGDAVGARLERRAGDDHGARGRAVADRPIAAPADGGVVDAARLGWREGRAEPEFRGGRNAVAGADARERRNGSFWSDAEWIICHDGKARRAQPGIRLLADGVPGRVGLWRIAGNAIVPQLAAEVLGALIDVLPAWRPATGGAA